MIWILGDHFYFERSVFVVLLGVVDKHFYTDVKIDWFSSARNSVYIIENFIWSEQYDLRILIIWVHNQEIYIVNRRIWIFLVKSNKSNSRTGLHSQFSRIEPNVFKFIEIYKVDKSVSSR